MCHEAGVTVTALPGAAACITALTISGLGTRRFAFEAFFPTDKKERQDVLEELKNAGIQNVDFIIRENQIRLFKKILEYLNFD